MREHGAVRGRESNPPTYSIRIIYGCSSGSLSPSQAITNVAAVTFSSVVNLSTRIVTLATVQIIPNKFCYFKFQHGYLALFYYFCQKKSNMSKNNKTKPIQLLSPENYIRQKARNLPIYECKVSKG